MSDNPNLIRLSKRMGLTGMYSRHEADKLIAQGYVTVDGRIAVSGEKVTESGNEVILVRGVPLGKTNQAVYKFHKPRGVLSSYSDPNGKRNLSSFKEIAAMKLGYSGRLDYDSEGLMLFTASGDLIQKLQRSEFSVEKEYLVETDKDISHTWIERLRRGIFSQGEQFLPCQVEAIDRCLYKVILVEGKKRQVRRMFKEAGATVKRLLRVRIGTVMLDNLRPGQLKKLANDELKELEICIESQ